MKGMKREPPGDSAAQTRAKIDAYMFAMQAVLALEKIFSETWRAQVRQGPKMKTSAGGEVTPDMTFEVAGGRFAGYRAVNEIKSRYPPRGRSRRRLARQLQLYDDIKSGWSLPAAPGAPAMLGYDLMLTVPAAHASDYVANLPKDLRTSGVTITRRFCILGSDYDSRGGGNRTRTRMVHGRLSVPEIERRLAKGDAIETYGILGGIAGAKFYDSYPPVPYMMSVLWSYVFPGMIHDAKRKSLFQGRTVKANAEAKRVHKRVLKFAPPSNPRCIRMSWVATALDEFVNVGLAKKVGDGKYEVWYRLGTPPVLDWLTRLVCNAHGDGAGALPGAAPCPD